MQIDNMLKLKPATKLVGKLLVPIKNTYTSIKKMTSNTNIAFTKPNLPTLPLLRWKYFPINSSSTNKEEEKQDRIPKNKNKLPQSVRWKSKRVYIDGCVQNLSIFIAYSIFIPFCTNQMNTHIFCSLKFKSLEMCFYK